MQTARKKEPKEREASCDDDRVIALIRSVRVNLSERDAAIFDGRLFGELTLEELARQFGLSRERIRQVEEKLLKRVKALVLGQRVKNVKVARIRRRGPVAAPAAPESAERLTGTG